MAYNGAGVFVINSAGQPVVTGTTITSTAFNALTADLGSGLTTAITKDGQTTVTNNLPMSNYRHTGVDATSGTNSKTEYLASGVAQNSGNIYATTTGSANAYVLTLTPAITAYAAGQTFRAKANFSNSGSTTIAVSGLTATAIQKNGVALVSNDIITGNIIEIVYDGTQFQLISRNNVAAANTWGGIQTFSNGIIFANETLATYDEGVFTAALLLGGGSASLTESTLKYIKIGNQVTINGRLAVNTVSTPSGTLYVTGLPFTIYNSVSNLTVGVLLPQQWGAGLTTGMISRAILNTTTLLIYMGSPTGGSTATNVANNLANGSEMEFGISYFTV